MGTFFGKRFEVVRELGRGARGTVYLAEDRREGMCVALKVIPSSLISSADEWRREFALLSHVQDPSLARVYDCGFNEEQGSYFLAEEYFDGQPLSNLSGRLDLKRIAEVTAQLGRVLQRLHLQGIFHGDLKPTNILVNGDRVKVIDFGLARRFGASQLPGTTAVVSGTVSYMAPELLLGAPVDGRTDLYALGATLYEILCGRPPFEAPTVASLIEKHLFETPANPVPEGSTIPKEFGLLVLRLLNKDPVDRFEEANDVIRALNLKFGCRFALGPEKDALPAQRREELARSHVDRLYERAIRFYEKKEDPESGRVLAEIHYQRGEWEKALTRLEGLSGVSIELLRLRIGLKKGEFERVCRQGKRLVSRVPEKEAGILHNLLGTALYYLGRYEESEAAFHEASSRFEKQEDRVSQAFLLNNLGNLKSRDRKWDEAIGLYEGSVSLCRQGGDAMNEGVFLMSLGYAHHLKGDHEAALRYYKESEEILDAVGYRAGAGKVKGNLANLFVVMGSLEKAEEKLTAAERAARETGDRFGVAYSRLVAGDLFRRKGKISEALEAYREGRALFRDLDLPQEEETAERNIAELLQSEAHEKSAAERHPETPAFGADASFLKRLLAINRRISLLGDVDEILEAIIDAMLEFTAAERGFLILREGREGEDKNPAVRVRRNPDKDLENDFSSSLVQRVMRTGEPVITVNAMTDERFSWSLSIHKLKLRSVICIPLRAREAVIGAIYLDNRLQKGAFTESTVDLLQAFADQAAIAVTNARSLDDLKKGAAALKASREDIQSLNRKLEEALARTEAELRETRNVSALRQSALELKYRYDGIIGRSPRMVDLLKLLDRVTDGDVPVFLFGESGTGKELLARAIHFNGPKAKGPFVPVNCGAIPDTLLESELFGSTRGAFTGADREREGLFEQANGGTLFLDEIGDMPLSMQAKLLRVLQDQEVRRLGSKTSVKVNVRIVTASHHDLETLVREKTFREDLFFRVKGIRLHVPPLRERREDIPALADHFLGKIAERQGPGAERKSLSRKAVDRLLAYHWPGNVRELEGTIANAALLAEDSKIRPEDLGRELLASDGPLSFASGDGDSLRESLAAYEKGLVGRVLQECYGNITHAAERLQIARPQLSRFVKRHRLKAKP